MLDPSDLRLGVGTIGTESSLTKAIDRLSFFMLVCGWCLLICHSFLSSLFTLVAPVRWLAELTRQADAMAPSPGAGRERRGGVPGNCGINLLDVPEGGVVKKQ